MAVQTDDRAAAITAPASDPTRRAWAVLLLCFGIFCLLVGLLVYGIWHVRSAATTPEQTHLSIHAQGVVLLQDRGLLQQRVAVDGEQLEEGDTVIVGAGTRYGIGATLRLFDGTIVELWPQTIVRLETIQTRRFQHSSKTIVLALERGMLRIQTPVQRDVRPDDYKQVDYRVRARRPNAEPDTILLQPGGTYRVRLIADGHPTTFKTEAGMGPATEVVVSAGEARLESGSLSVSQISPGKRALVDAEGIKPLAEARWELIQDGSFSAFTEEEYNCTTVDCPPEMKVSNTWTVRADQIPEESEESDEEKPKSQGGLFRISNGPASADGAPSKAATFTRNHSLGKGQRVYLHQYGMYADVTPYAEVTLEADLRILHQSLPKAGVKGTECPIAIQIHYLPLIQDGKPPQVDFCYYALDDPQLPEAADDHIKTEQLRLGEWEHIKLDLRKLIPRLETLEFLTIYANGHDYNVQIANVSVTAR